MSRPPDDAESNVVSLAAARTARDEAATSPGTDAALVADDDDPAEFAERMQRLTAERRAAQAERRRRHNEQLQIQYGIKKRPDPGPGGK